jgi:FtsP/CotA-like multicopper oxidase with cupredoxin domain
MPMEAVSGFFGGIVLVNGRMPPTFALASRAYRFRLLNGSHSRVYKLAWSDDAPITVIGSDGGLLEKPLQRPFLTLAPGERADLVRDLSESAVGARIELYSLPFPTSAFEMGMDMGMMRGRGRMGGRGVAPLPSDGAPASLLTIHVERREASRFELPASLSAFGPAWQPAAAGRVAARVFPVDFSGMQWLLNGRTFVMEEVAANETVTAGAKEVWEFTNTGAGMMGMGLAHPLHVHGRQFRILNREIDRATAELWAPLREGLTDEGWKDTFLIMPGERVQILVEASHHPGLYLYHCHNLVHEDMGMMRNYRIVAAAG